MNEYQRSHKEGVKDFLRRYKTERGCTDCGYNEHHAALDFDHVRGEKEINVSFAKSIRQAMGEIEKCEVVCSNCHRIRSFNRLQERRANRQRATYELVDDA